MDILIEAILEFLLEGSMEIGADPTSPKGLRILAWIVIGICYTAMLVIGGLLIYSGFQKCDRAIIIVGVLLEAILAALVVAFLRKVRNR